MRRLRRAIVLGLLVGLGLAGVVLFRSRSRPPSLQPGVSVWACGEGWKIGTQTPPVPSAAYEAPRGEVRLFGGRQEYVAFQLVCRSDRAPLAGLSLRLNALSLASSPGEAPRGSSRELPVANIDVFHEHPLRVRVSSQNGPSHPVPQATTGEFPAQLVPLPVRRARDGATCSAPLASSQGRNETFWVDLYIPEDQAPGEYRGELEVLARGALLKRIGIRLTVLRFTLPRETHFKTFCEASTNDLRWGYGGIPPDRIDTPEFRSLEDRCFQLAHQHRINFNLYFPGADEVDVEQRYRAYLDGTAFRERACPGVGLNLWMVGFGQEGVERDDEASVRDFVRRILAQRRRFGWRAEFACYLADEPKTPEEFAAAARRAGWIHSAAGNELPTYLTTPDWQRMPRGSVDIWGELRPEAIPGRVAAGQRVWGVNTDYATGPYVDTPATAGRALIWMGWRLGLDAYHYWNFCYWVDRQNLPGPGGRPLTTQRIDADPGRYLTDTWRQPLTFDQTRRPGGKAEPIRINGDGVLIYPGSPASVGPDPSLQLKSLRRGLQDYEYLWLLRRAGVETSEIVRRLVPRANRWEVAAEPWEVARLALARRLDALASRPEGRR